MPPAVAVANETTSTPKRSSRCLTPAAAPLRAKTNVPTSSSTSSVPVAYSLKPASLSRTCSAPNAGIIPGHGWIVHYGAGRVGGAPGDSAHFVRLERTYDAPLAGGTALTPVRS